MGIKETIWYWNIKLISKKKFLGIRLKGKEISWERYIEIECKRWFR